MKRRVVCTDGLFAAAMGGLVYLFPASAGAFSGAGCLTEPDVNYSIGTAILDEVAALHSPTARAEEKACAYLARGALYHLEGQVDRAIADYTSALGWMKNFQSAYELRGDAYEDLGQHDKALADYAEAAKDSAETPQGLNDRCWARAVRGRPLDRALADCTAALREESRSIEDRYDSRCFVYYRMADYRSAIADCDAALAIQPKLAGSLYIRGLAKLRLGDTAGGNADLAAAKDSDRRIAEQYEIFGVKPDSP